MTRGVINQKPYNLSVRRFEFNRDQRERCYDFRLKRVVLRRHTVQRYGEAIYFFWVRSQEQLLADWLSSCLQARWHLSRIMKTDKKDGIFNRYSQLSWHYPCKINCCADIKLGFVSPATGQRGHQHWILLDSLVLDSSCSTTRKLPTPVVWGDGINPALHCSRNLPRCYLLPLSSIAYRSIYNSVVGAGR